jgi:cytochrome c biogenesis protein CcdA
VVEVGFLASFLGGLLSLLSPCSALLLPAFFAYAFQSRYELAWRTAVFYAGLTATLVPLGMGISAVGSLVYGHRGAVILASGLLLVFFGLVQLLGRGFTLAPIQRLIGAIRGESTAATFALGAVYGFAGFCSGPILGAVLTVAAGSGSALRGAGLLALYAAGMALPLLVLALLWDGLDLGHRRWLRGREVTLGRLRLHTTNLVSGLLFVGLGIAFIAYEGTLALEGFYVASGATDLALAADAWIGRFAGTPAATLLLVALGLLLAAALLRGWRRRGDRKPPGGKVSGDGPW